MNPAVSIITVCFNAEHTIASTLRSVASQTWSDLEHVIVDGASQDGTTEIVREYMDQRVRFFSEPDHGIYDAMNKGIRLSTGNVIGFLNADDEYADARVLADVAERFTDSSIQAVFGDLVYCSNDGQQLVRHWKSHPYRPGDFGRGWLPPHPTLFIRRSVYQQLGQFDVSYGTAADFDLMNRFFTRGRIRSVYIPRTLVRMCVGGISNQSWRSVMHAQIQNARSLINTFGMVPPAYPFLKLADRLRQFRRAKRINIRNGKS